MFQAGIAKVLITPPIGSPLTGYAARQGVSTGVHDDLFARALVLVHGGVSMAMVSVEVLALGAEFVNGARRRIAARTGIPAESILIAATHTHSGPVTIRTFFNEGERLDTAYMARLEAAIDDAVLDAWQHRFAARIGTGACAVEGVGANRCDPSRVIDREAGVIRVDDATGRLRAVVVQYGCHPTLLGFSNLLVTGDYPAMALAAIEQAAPGCQAMFFNGAEGNVSVNHASELNAIGVATPDRTFPRAKEIGGRLAAAVLTALPRIATRSNVEISVIHWPFELAAREYPDDVDEAYEAARRRTAEAPDDDEILLRKARAAELYAAVDRANARMVRESGGKVPFPLQAVLIGDAVFLGVPGELFSETGLALKRKLARPLFIIGLANGYTGYVPTESAFREGGYESAVAFCAADSERRLLEAVEQLLPREVRR